MLKYSIAFSLLATITVIQQLWAGNTGKIAGVIQDADTGDPLIGANIVVESQWVDGREVNLELPLGASTDTEGYYFILNLRPGSYNIRATYIGYREELKTQVDVIVDKTTRLDFNLAVQALELEDVVVTAYQQTKVEKDLTATKQVYTVSEVQSIAGVQDISDILELQADVVDDHFRGGRVGESTYLLGGATIVNPLDNSRAFNPIVTGLDQVEVYTSGFSAEYGNAQSGVVNMVTREGTATWQTRLEFSGTLPYYKSWNGSVYSPDNLLFYELLKNTDEWLKENPLDPGKPLWDRGYGVTKYIIPKWPPNTREDSLRFAEFGRIMWLQSIREVGLEYDNTIDNRVDLTTGGPVARNTLIFLAARQNTINPVVPTTQPDLERQLMGNLVYSPRVRDKIKLTFIYDYNFLNYLGSNWERWMFDRTFSITKRTQKSWQYSMEWKHVFNPASFADLNFNILNVKEEDRIDLLEEGQFLEDYSNNRNWVDYTGPSNHRVGRVNDDRGNKKTRTYYLGGSFTSQIDRYNLLKSGLQLYYYDIHVDYEENVTNRGSIQYQKFTATPFEGGIYFQDKMEYEGFIANLGLRFDLYNLNTTYYTDKFNPLLDPEAIAETKLYTRLQPRIGFSFPVSEATVFHLNYGTFTQRPNFNQLFFNEVNESDNVVRVISLGNPELKPENTKAYDAGIVHLLAPGIQLDVSAYYKDVKDLIQTAFFKNKSGEAYTTYINLDYADIKGFHVSLEKNYGFLRGYIRYNFESATGKSGNSDNLDVAPIFTEEENPEEEALSERFPEDVYLDYDRTHKAVFNLRFLTNPNYGMEIWGFKPFASISFSTTYRFYSGRPYTWDESGQGLKYNQRTPQEHDLRLRLEKTFQWGTTRLTGYFEAFNLLDLEYWHYTRTFNNDRNVVRWETLPKREDILIEDLYAPYITRQDVYLLRNEPRHYRLGIIFRF